MNVLVAVLFLLVLFFGTLSVFMSIRNGHTTKLSAPSIDFASIHPASIQL